MKGLPIGISTFSLIIENNLVYVDKTEFIERLRKNKLGRYFLARPRRFGKSLFLDTLNEIFKGNKELFKGLYIYEKWDWNRKHPVIKLDFVSVDSRTIEILEEDIISKLNFIGREENIKYEEKTAKNRFRELINILREKYNEKVVILIDEYDKPLLDNIENVSIANEIREYLKRFYSVIKEEDKNIEFVFITGVTKFSKVNIFSGINNLKDITLSSEYASICGYTEKDLNVYFYDYLKDIDWEDLRRWYNGYNFMGEKVYNPFDILLFISENKIYRNYWFETGTPTFLMKLLKEKNSFIPELDEIEVGEELISTFELDKIDVKTILFQTGYLTIKEYKLDKNEGIKFILTYPNHEVKTSLNNYIFADYTELNQDYYKYKNSIVEVLKKGDIEGLKEVIYRLFSSIPYKYYTNTRLIEFEGYYASVLYTLFVSVGCVVIAEDITNYGQCDFTVIKKDNVYVIEIKVVNNEEVQNNEALEQIKKKRYSEKYIGMNNKKIYEIGIVFSSKKRNVIRYDWGKIK